MTHPTLLDDPGHWLARAEEARILANEMRDLDARQQMLKIVEAYEILAKRALERARTT